MRFSIIDKIIFKVTARRWNRLISTVLCQQYEHGTINSAQLHRISAEFDPTQDAAFKRISNSQLLPRATGTSR